MEIEEEDEEKKDKEDNKNEENVETKEIETENGKDICKFYLQKRCKHYREKEKCKYSHPKLCFNWIKKGTCKDKEMCKEFFHPKLCHQSLENLSCNREKCKFFHLPNTKFGLKENKQTKPSEINKEQVVPNQTKQPPKEKDFQPENKAQDPDPTPQGALMDLIQKLTTRVETLVKENTQRKSMDGQLLQFLIQNQQWNQGWNQGQDMWTQNQQQ